MDAGNKKEPGHSRTDTARKIVVSVLVVLCITLLAAVVYLLKEKKTAPAADQITDWDTGIEEDPPQGADAGILVPGYDTAVMDAGSDHLPMSIGNPKDNQCLMKVTLCLEDGTELYESSLLAPGEGMEKVILNQSMKEGTYDMNARFECFSKDDKHTPLNVADSGFVLIVKEKQ